MEETRSSEHQEPSHEPWRVRSHLLRLHWGGMNSTWLPHVPYSRVHILQSRSPQCLIQGRSGGRGSGDNKHYRRCHECGCSQSADSEVKQSTGRSSLHRSRKKGSQYDQSGCFQCVLILLEGLCNPLLSSEGTSSTSVRAAGLSPGGSMSVYY